MNSIGTWGSVLDVNYQRRVLMQYAARGILKKNIIYAINMIIYPNKSIYYFSFYRSIISVFSHVNSSSSLPK